MRKAFWFEGVDIQIVRKLINQLHPKGCISTRILKINGIENGLARGNDLIEAHPGRHGGFAVRIIGTNNLATVKIILHRSVVEPECGDQSGGQSAAIFERNGCLCSVVKFGGFHATFCNRLVEFFQKKSPSRFYREGPSIFWGATWSNLFFHKLFHREDFTF